MKGLEKKVKEISKEGLRMVHIGDGEALFLDKYGQFVSIDKDATVIDLTSFYLYQRNVPEQSQIYY
nr:hypothetical protein [Candidatus Woesearchaeota archaeon]